MLDRILNLAHTLRDKDVPVSTPEIADCLSALASFPYYDEQTVKTIISSSLVKDREHHPLFEESYEDLFSTKENPVREQFPPMTGETEMDITIPAAKSESKNNNEKDAGQDKQDGPYLPGQTALMDVPFLYTGIKQREEMLSLIKDLSRRMAAKMSIREKGGGRRLNYRRVWRKSMQTGGIPFEPVWQQRRLNKPRTFVICDFSNSMNAYLPFVLQFVFTFAASYSTVRVFGFVDAIEEITAKIDPFDIKKSIDKVYGSARIQRQGKTDYGNALKGFCRHYIQELTNRSNVIIVGDARNNRFNPQAHLLNDIKTVSAAVYWLNPEKWYYWGFADSCMASYITFCDGAFEMANLNQLKYFVDYLASPLKQADSLPALPVSREKWNIYLNFIHNWHNK